MKRTGTLAAGLLTAALVWIGTAAADEPAAWPPAAYVEKLKAEPKTELDGQIKTLIADYEARIAKLDASSAKVKFCLPRLRDNLDVLYREYNQPNRGKRYAGDCFPAADCIKWLQRDMAIFLDQILGEGKDPTALASGRWHGKVAWIDGTEIMGHYDLQVPKNYDPAKSYPIIISYQSNPDRDKIAEAGYFLLKSIQVGYPKGLVGVEAKTRSFLKDACRQFNIDPFRVYATGFSFGGHTDLVMAWEYPHWFAAIAPVCSDLRGDAAANVKWLQNVPTLLLHGEGDSFRKTGELVHQYMVEAGCPVEWGTFPGGHSSDGVFEKDPQRLIDFFAKHVMDPYPKRVCHVITHKRYSRAFWVNGKVTKDAGGLQATFEVRVKDGNRIEVDANDQIQELTLYLNDKLVDMAKPVTVVAGEKTLYQGEPQAELTLKLRDGQDFFQRPGDTLWADMQEIKKTAIYAPGK